MLVVDQAILLIEGFYVHLPLKRAMYAVDPLQRLRLLRHRLPDIKDDRDFHQEMMDVFTAVRDQHTIYYLPAFANTAAALPFSVEAFVENGTRKYIVTKFKNRFNPPKPSFCQGVEIMSWNGVPIARAVLTSAAQTPGANSEARHALGLARLTQRALSVMPPPDEQWVHVGYKTADGGHDEVRIDREAYAKDPNSLGPNVRANYEMSVNMTLADMAWAHAEQTRIFRRFQAKFHEYDLVLSPTTPVSPFPWTRLYLEELEGTRLRNYYHWLALTYVITLTTNPAISIPCGVDEHTMPFGLQVTGRFRGDRDLVDAAEAMEQAFANIPGLGRPRPDLGKLAKPTVDLKSIATHPPLQ